MPDLICVKEIYEKRRKPNPCGCPWCRKTKEHLDALEFYRRDMGPGTSYYDLFPEKQN